jgi:hypothetical protein
VQCLLQKKKERKKEKQDKVKNSPPTSGVTYCKMGQILGIRKPG